MACNTPTRPQLQLMQGYTILILDTNIILSSLPMVTSLIECLRWTAVVPLPAIMELDRLALNAKLLGDAAKAAVVSVVSHVCLHADLLNYLSSLTVHMEQVNFDYRDS